MISIITIMNLLTENKRKTFHQHSGYEYAFIFSLGIFFVLGKKNEPWHGKGIYNNFIKKMKTITTKTHKYRDRQSSKNRDVGGDGGSGSGGCKSKRLKQT